MAASAAYLAFRSNWNPWPMVAAMVAGGLVLNFGPGAWSRVKQACDMSPKTPEQWALEHFGKTDPLVAICGDGSLFDWRMSVARELPQKFREKLKELRRYFVDIDGSGKDGTLNRVNPVQLPMWMRWAYLPDFVGLNPGGTENWRFSSPNLSSGRYDSPDVYMSYKPLGSAPDVRQWDKAYPLIKALLGHEVCFKYSPDCGYVYVQAVNNGDPAGGWLNDPTPINPTAEQEALALGIEALPYEPLPFVLNEHPHGHLAEGYLYFGEQFLDRMQGGHWLKIADLNHTLVMGTSGFGKSVFLNQVLEGVAFNAKHFDQVVLVDLKGGVELWPYQARGARFRVVYRFDDLAPLVAELVATIEDRLEQMRRMNARMWPGAKTLFVVDEYAQIQLSPEATKEERQKKQELLANLNKISMLGRAAGVIIWAQLQKGTTDVMDSSFRGNLSNQVCFKVPNKLTAAGMFGSTDELMVDPVKLPKGRFILYNAGNGETHYLQGRIVA